MSSEDALTIEEVRNWLRESVRMYAEMSQEAGDVCDEMSTLHRLRVGCLDRAIAELEQMKVRELHMCGAVLTVCGTTDTEKVLKRFHNTLEDLPAENGNRLAEDGQ